LCSKWLLKTRYSRQSCPRGRGLRVQVLSSQGVTSIGREQPVVGCRNPQSAIGSLQSTTWFPGSFIHGKQVLDRDIRFNGVYRSEYVPAALSKDFDSLYDLGDDLLSGPKGEGGLRIHCPLPSNAAHLVSEVALQPFGIHSDSIGLDGVQLDTLSRSPRRSTVNSPARSRSMISASRRSRSWALRSTCSAASRATITTPSSSATT